MWQMSKDHQSQQDGLHAPKAQPGHSTSTPGSHQATLYRKHMNSLKVPCETTEALVGTALSEEEHNIVSASGPLGRCSL